MKKLLIGVFAILSIAVFADTTQPQDASTDSKTEIKNFSYEQDKERLNIGINTIKEDLTYVSAIGSKNEIKGSWSIFIGRNNTDTGANSITRHIALGTDNTFGEGSYLTAIGDSNKISGAYSKAIGDSNEIKSTDDNQDVSKNLIFGYNNKIKDSHSNIVVGNNSAVNKGEIKTESNVAVGNQISINGGEDSVALGTGAEIKNTTGAVSLGGFSYVGDLSTEYVKDEASNGVYKKITKKDNDEYKIDFKKSNVGEDLLKVNGKAYAAMALGYVASAHNEGASSIGTYSTAIGKGSTALGRLSASIAEESVALGSLSVADRKEVIGKSAINIVSGQEATEDDIFEAANVDKTQFKKLDQEIKTLKDEVVELQSNQTVSPDKQGELEELEKNVVVLEKNKKDEEIRFERIKKIYEGMGSELTEDSLTYKSFTGNIKKYEEELKEAQTKLEQFKKDNVDKTIIAQIENKNNEISEKRKEIDEMASKLIAWKSTLGAVSLGVNDKHTRQITNLAAGSKDTDAVNLAQLKSVMNLPVKFYKDNEVKAETKLSSMNFELGEGLKAEKKENGRVFIGLDSKGLENNESIVNLRKEIESTGAMSAALAGLGTVASQTGHGDQILFAIGTHSGKKAIAIGATKYINNNAVISLGVAKESAKGSSYMGNIGFSYKFGEKPYTNNETEKLKKEVKELKKELENLKKLLLEIKNK